MISLSQTIWLPHYWPAPARWWLQKAQFLGPAYAADSTPLLYLTFDDGPHPSISPSLLALLNEASVPASFFYLGSAVASYPNVEQLAELLSNGQHVVGNHGYHHTSWHGMTPEVLAEQVAQTNTLLVNSGLVADYSNVLVRPPYGHISRVQLQNMQQQVVLWSWLTGDYDARLSPEQCLSRAVAAMRPGAIYVFHENDKAASTMQWVVPRMITAAHSAGYRFSTLDKLV